MANHGAASEQMAQYIGELLKENENKSLWIGTLMNESRAQAQVLEQHRLGQEVIAEVIKRMMAEQQRQQPEPEQTLTGLGPMVTEVDEGDQRARIFREARTYTQDLRTTEGSAWRTNTHKLQQAWELRRGSEWGK